jgi:hypothetical protein
MGLGIDTILANAVNPGAGGAAASVAASGDPTIIRAFQTPAKAYLDGITRMGTTLGFAQVVSPTLHDPVTGLRVTPGETPSVFALPGRDSQEMTTGDQLTLSLSGGAAETDVMALHLYYTDTGGVDGSFYLPGDIDGNIDNVKTQRVAVTSSATIGAWSDTLVGSTENLLVANRDYAVLGYMTNTALAVIGIRSSNTGNLRACGPGSTSEFPTTQYFAYMAEKTGRPYIPVFNQQNAGNTFVSVAAATASVAAVVTLVLAELKNRITK